MTHVLQALLQKQNAVALSRPVELPAAAKSDRARVVAVDGPELKQVVQTDSKKFNWKKKNKHSLQVRQRDHNEWWFPAAPRPLNPTPSQSERYILITIFRLIHLCLKIWACLI